MRICLLTLKGGTEIALLFINKFLSFFSLLLPPCHSFQFFFLFASSSFPSFILLLITPLSASFYPTVRTGCEDPQCQLPSGARM